jgi:hypothetical protein
VDFWTVAEKYGLPAAMMLYAITALYIDWVVSGRRYRLVVTQRDRLLKLALSGQRKANTAVDIAGALVGPSEGEPDDDEV